MRAKPGLRVFLKWMIYRSGSVIAAVIRAFIDATLVKKLFETESYVSVDAAWHQELTFDQPYSVTVVIENLGRAPLYGFYLNEVDFQQMIENGRVGDTIMARIQDQLLCVNEYGIAELDVTFPLGTQYVCMELDVESKAQAERTDFRFSLHEKQGD